MGIEPGIKNVLKAYVMQDRQVFALFLFVMGLFVFRINEARFSPLNTDQVKQI